jgi:Domain of unknown function (DUF4062)
MNFEGDAFISYAHMDDVELIEGHKGWVANLHRALAVRVGQLLGEQPQIWRDPKLQGNDLFAETLIQRLRRVAVLISVVSPRYVRSEWTRRELTEFWNAAEQQGGIRFRDRARIFKVLKTPVPLEMLPPELQAVLGYEFFKVDPDTGRVRELDEAFGADAQRDFWFKLDDLAQDVCCLLQCMRAASGPLDRAATGSPDQYIFLAETTSDLREQHDSIKRDLQQLGCTVLPAQSLPQVASELKAALREDLARCQMSIHLVGKNYGLVPEGGTQSLIEIQYELASERAEKGNYCRLVWIPPDLQVEHEKQRGVIDQLRMDPTNRDGSDLLETSLEDLKTIYHDRLKPRPEPAPEEIGQAATNESLAQIYLIYDQRDTAAASPWVEFLFQQGFEVMRPVFEGDEAELREYHEESLRNCDGALILHGQANECWLRRKLREVQKSSGLSRSKPKPTIFIALVPPKTAEKESFQTREGTVIRQLDGFSTDPLAPFISRLKGR